LAHAVTIAVPSTDTDTDSRTSPLGGIFTAFASMVSGYFFLACASLYWLTVGAGALVGVVLPRRLIERAPLVWLSGSSLLMAAATQTVSTFFPDYTNPKEIAAEVGLWLAIGLFARCYLVYTDFPATFEGLKQSIASRSLDRRISSVLHHPIDAIFTRVWVANSIAIIPLTLLLMLPATMNYFVIAAYSVALLLSQFPHELIDHVNIHTRVFQPKIGASPRAKKLLRALQFYFENVLAILLARAPQYHRIQHVYVHHVEDNGPLDSQTTAPYDRTSFLDFSRHAFLQGVDMVTGVSVLQYLRAKGKKRQLREVLHGFVTWYAVLAVLALFNPLAASLVFVSRFVGGNILSLVAFWQHGLVDPADMQDVHGNSVDFVGHEHGNLGSDYHVEHHLQPGRHWSAYYEVYSKQANAEGGHAAVVMQKEMFGPLAFVAALWKKDYTAVATYARLRGVDEGNTQELAKIVEERTRPIGMPGRTGFAARIDTCVGRVMALALPTAFRV
jgi:fatty acid desaturase